MERRTRRFLFIYLSFMMTLAAVGAFNQKQFMTHWQLMRTKEQHQVRLSDLRAQAAYITGPLAVRQWARERGMVSTPEGQAALTVYPVPAPSYHLPQAGGLEIRTVWR